MISNNYHFSAGARFALLLAVLFAASMGMAQVQTQKGVSYRYNGKNPRTPLPNVTVECVTANNAVVSDSTGSFTLTFNKLKMGDRMGLVTVKKREMMVFNQQAVDEWSIRKEPLCLILCNADEFDRQKKEYMELGRKDARRRYDREKAELEKQLKEGNIKQEDLENALNIAYERLERLQKEIDKYADDLARIDLSELDDKMQEILEMYRRGETEEAIERLKSLKLAEEFDKETAHYEVVQQELQRSDNKLQTLVERMKSSVVLLKNSGEWEEAGKYLKRIADKTNNYDDVFAYAYFSTNQNNHQEAIDYYNRALRLIDEDKDKDSLHYQYKKAPLLNNLASLYSITQRYMESETMYLEALEINRRLAEANKLMYWPSNPYESDVAKTLNNLAGLYSISQRYAQSETLYLEALEINRRLVKANQFQYWPSSPYETDLARTLNGLAVLYSNTQRHTESESMYMEALEIQRRQAQANPQAYEPDLARTLNGLANLYFITQRYTESETMYMEALEIQRRLAQINLQAYEPDLARTLNCLALLYFNTQRFTESEAMYKEALLIRRRLAQANPQAYEPNIAAMLNTLGYINILQEQYQKAIPYYEESLSMFRKLAAIDPNQQQWYENSLYWLAKLNSSLGNHTKSYELYEEYIPLLKSGLKINSNYREYISALGGNAFHCLFLGLMEKSEQYAREALSIDSTQHWINTNLASALLLQGKYSEAEAIYRQYKDELKDSFLQDLQDFEAAGIIPEERKEDVEKIRQLLNE